MSRPFRCTIVTPNEAAFDEQIVYASVPAWDGQFGVMIDESPLLTRLDAGVLRVDLESGGQKWYMIDVGFAQAANNVLTILTNQAFPASELAIDQAETELAAANARVGVAGEDQDAVRVDQARAYAKKSAIAFAR